MKEMIQSSYKSFVITLVSLLLSLINFSELQSQGESKSKITIIYPKPNQIISPQDGYALILGNVSNDVKELLINSEKVNFDKDGSFLYYSKIILPSLTDSIYLAKEKYLNGYFQIEVITDKSRDTFLLPVKVNKPLKTLAEDKIIIDENFQIEPSEDLVLNPGEILDIKFKATPNCKGYFLIDGEKEKYPLVENLITNEFYLGEAVFGSGFKLSKDTIKGIYEGHLIIPSKDWKDKKLKIVLEHSKLGKKEFLFPSKITVNTNLQYRVVRILKEQNLVVGRTGPMLGYRLFLPEGVKAICDGERKDFLRLRLSSNQSVFVPKNSAEFLPEGTLPPKSTIEVIRTKDAGNFVRVEIGLHEKLPYEIKHVQNNNLISLKIFNAVSNIDWVFFDRNQNLITDVNWSQINNDELEIKIKLNQKNLWGYFIDYEDNILVLKIKKSPSIKKRFLFFGSPLEGRTIVLDPGHNADDGAVGPSGLKEKDINLVLAKITKEVLEKEGAKVYLTREDNPLPLRERKAKVISFNPDFSISIHNNAVPDGVNPIKHNGFSVYYYNENAREFAFILHQKLKEKLDLPDFGLYWDNLYMCRIPETIAVLVEPTFIIHPHQEKLLKDKEFQLKVANAIKDALIEFLDRVRE
ncbi:MAG: N-acetylmuramoyl-L-alanine amidase [Ignavibacteria bacterium]|nr:N-acetylmuramoyl-L-alanine amidase [Ignavibacteria bacterium]